MHTYTYIRIIRSIPIHIPHPHPYPHIPHPIACSSGQVVHFHIRIRFYRLNPDPYREDNKLLFYKD